MLPQQDKHTDIFVKSYCNSSLERILQDNEFTNISENYILANISRFTAFRNFQKTQFFIVSGGWCLGSKDTDHRAACFSCLIKLVIH